MFTVVKQHKSRGYYPISIPQNIHGEASVASESRF